MPLKILLATFMLAGAVSATYADQTDPQLDALFEALSDTSDTRLLSEIEGRIWSLWYQHDDGESQAMLMAGERLVNAGYFGDALRVFNTLVEREPDFAEAWNRRATLHYLMGNLAESISDIDRTLELEPRHFGALSGLGLVYLQHQNLSGAREAFERLLAIHPHSPAGQRNLERVLEEIRSRFI